MELSTDNSIHLNIWRVQDSDYFDNFLHNLANNNYQYHIYWAQDEFEFWRPGRVERWLKIINVCVQRNIKLTVLTGASHYNNHDQIPYLDKINLIYWTSYWFTRTFTDMFAYNPDFRQRRNRYIFNQDKIDYEFRFICLNKRPKPFRCEIMDLLCKENLLYNNAISWFYDEIKEAYEFKWWKPQILQLDKEFNNYSDQGCVPEQYYTSFAQLVPESEPNNAIMISEKTITPLIFGKPFLTAGAVNFHSHLKNLGFELYDEVFDYSFDKEDDNSKRWVLLIENFKMLEKESLDNLKHLAKKLMPKLVHNQHLAKELSFNFSYVPPQAKSVYKTFLNTGVILDHTSIDVLHKFHQFKLTKQYKTLPI